MSLRARIILAVTLCLLVQAGMLFLASGWTRDVAERRFTDATLDARATLWRNVLASELERMAGSIRELTRSRALLDALAAGEAGKLDETLRPTYNRLSTSGVLTNLEIANTSQEFVYSAVPATSRPADSLLSQAAQTGKIQRGMVRAAEHGMVAELIFPLFRRGKPVGYAVYSKTLQDALARFGANADAGAAIVDSAGVVRVASGDQDVPVADVAALIAGTEPRLEFVARGEQTVAVTVTPLAEASGRDGAYLVAWKDYTASFLQQATIDREALIVSGGTMLAVLVCLVVFLNHSFSRVRTVIRSMKAMAAGDLSLEIRSDGNDEFGKLLRETQNMRTALQGKLRGAVDAVNDSMGALVGAVQQLGTVTESTNAGARRQQDRARTLADRVSAILGSVRENASIADRARLDAEKAMTEAVRGKAGADATLQQVERLAEGFHEVSRALEAAEKAGHEIGKVTEAIDEIALQTNVLSLNAAIEASQAGEHGKGFAVVAAEVRQLALSTRDSTIESRRIMDNLQGQLGNAITALRGGNAQMDSTVRSTRELAAALESVSTAVSDIALANQEVARASGEQRTAAQEIERGIVEIREVADEATEGARKTASASETLASLTDQMQHVLRGFRLDTRHDAASRQSADTASAALQAPS